MAVTAGQLATAFSLAQVVLLFATAAFVWTLAPQSVAKRLLALLLALRGAAQVGDFLGQIDAPSRAAAYWFFVDMGLLHALALGAFAAIYPSRVRWRSAAGVLLALALGVFLAQAAGLTFARDAFYRTTAGDALFWLYVAGFGLAGLSCVLRFPELPARERRPASLVAFVLVGSAIAVPTYQVVLEAVAFGRTGTLLEPSPYPGAAPWLPPVLYATVAFVVLPAVAFVWYRRERHPIVPLVLAYGLATVPFAFFAGMPYYFFTILEAIVVLHLFARHPAMGVTRVPTGRATAMAVLAGAALFFAIVALALANFGDSSLSLAGGTLAGLVLGGTAFVATLPREHLPVRDDREEATRRLSAYGIALERELRAGRSPEEAGAALADLRAALRVSDDEHAALVSTRAPAAVGDALLLGRYRPLRVLGEGGGGVTRLCLDERVGREVVLKSLRGDDPSPERISVLLREARAVGSIKHPNVITLHDVVDSGREAIIVMEHAERGSLRDALKRGPLAPAEWRRVADGLLRALEAVHGAGVVHRDVKPSNVLIAADGTPKLADFGIAHVPGFETTVGGLRDAAVGTFRYMSPEQAKGRPANARSDLFSGAATLYEAFTGQPYLEPRPGESAVEVQMRAASGRAFDRDLEPSALRAWFARALDPEASQRFATARDAREALAAALAEDPLR